MEGLGLMVHDGSGVFLRIFWNILVLVVLGGSGVSFVEEAELWRWLWRVLGDFGHVAALVSATIWKV